jgi:hypothetical protein
MKFETPKVSSLLIVVGFLAIVPLARWLFPHRVWLGIIITAVVFGLIVGWLVRHNR